MSIFTRRNTLFGLLTWLIPFAASFAFFDRSGQLLISQPLFKSLMVVIAGGVGTALLVQALRAGEVTFKSATMIGVYWLILNLALDLLILVPMSGMSIALYVTDIGLRYLLIPIIAAGLGAIAESASVNRT